MRNQFLVDQFYTSGLTWSYKRKREGKESLPWNVSLEYQLSGNKLLGPGQNNASFRLMTGHKNKQNMHNYGIAMSSGGSLRGIPFPFYVYTTKIWEQNLTVGFPFLSLSGPKINKTNYGVSLSPLGANVKGIQKINDKIEVVFAWSLSVDSYVADSPNISNNESIFVEQQRLELEGKYKISKKLRANLSIGHEYNKRFFKGENIFKKENNTFDMKDSGYIKLGAGIDF